MKEHLKDELDTCLFVGLPGRVPPANRAELWAVIQVLAKVAPKPGAGTHIHTDSGYVYKKAVKHWSRWGVGADCDLWQLLKDQLIRHHGEVHFYKVKAHCKLQDVRVGVVGFHQCIGNFFAYKLADHFARRAALPSSSRRAAGTAWQSCTMSGIALQAP